MSNLSIHSEPFLNVNGGIITLPIPYQIANSQGDLEMKEKYHNLNLNVYSFSRDYLKISKAFSALLRKQLTNENDFRDNFLPKFSEEYNKEEGNDQQSVHFESEGKSQVVSRKKLNFDTTEYLNIFVKKKRMSNSKHIFTINEVLKFLIKWRSLCYSDKVLGGRKIFSKHDAAQMVSINKKSLDDYLMFVRLGISMNFDFKANSDKSINYLRKYIKNSPVRIHWKKNKFGDVESLQELIIN